MSADEDKKCQHEIIRNGTNGVELLGFRRCERKATHKTTTGDAFETYLCARHARTWPLFSKSGKPTRLTTEE